LNLLPANENGPKWGMIFKIAKGNKPKDPL